MFFDVYYNMEFKSNQITVCDFDAVKEGAKNPAGEIYVPEGMLIGICNRGQGRFMIDTRMRVVEKNAIMSVPPGQMFSVSSLSNDFQLTYILIPSDLVVMLTSRRDPKYLSDKFLQFFDAVQIFNFIESKGISVMHGIALPDNVADDVRSLLAILKKYSSREGNANLPFNLLLVESVIMLVIGTMPVHPRSPRPLTRQESLAQKFFSCLLVNFKEYHDVAFYASQLCVSPKYLSTVIRSETGVPALQWIDRIVVFGIKQSLAAPDVSVAQVSDEFHFSSPSSFIRFFKRHTGVTPLAFRRK